jgi:hypothetical protein
MARTIWPKEDALGKCVNVGSRAAPCARVVGIAADGHRTGLREEPSMQVYVPIGQERGFSGSWLLVRPSGALRMATSRSWQGGCIGVTRASGDSDNRRAFVVAGTRWGDASASIGDGGVWLRCGARVDRRGARFVQHHGARGCVARHEIGVRLALGARPRSIATLIVGRGAVLATIGIGLGLIIAFGARQWVEPLLFNTSATGSVVLWRRGGL